MKKITLFYLEDCPYCHFAKRAIEELKSENHAYETIDIEWIEERKNPSVAEQYDYYYVPTIFYSGTNLYEAHPSEKYGDCKANIKNAFDIVLR